MAQNEQLKKEVDKLNDILELRDQEVQLRVNEIRLLKNSSS
jgi:hypothetical protein